MTWANWSGRQGSKHCTIHHARSEADITAIVTNADGPIRCAGAGHSHAPLVVTDGLVLDLSGLSGVLNVDPDRREATVWAGTRIYALGRPLHDAGFALHNQGDIDQQAIAGATGTGTHGTGETLRNLSAAVTGLVLITGDGQRIDANAGENETLWQATRLHLGAFGVVTQLNLSVQPAYLLEEGGWQSTYDKLTDEIESLPCQHRHFEFFWYPPTDTATVKVINPCDGEPQYPLAEEGQRRAWSYEVLPNHRPHKHTEMEYSVPREQGPACFAAIRELLHTRFTDVRWPVEYRTLAADDVWLSTAYERDTVTISVHQDIREDETPYYRACEEIFLAHGGRPHWGKVHFLDKQQMARCHPRWEDWWRVRDETDPHDKFLNAHLSALRP